MTNKQLPIGPLEYAEIRQLFVDFLRADPNYKDYNLEASGISTLLNTMAYQAHMIGFYVKMLLDESFVDSSKTREAMYSHAKRVGYLPKGKKAAIAEVKLATKIPNANVPASGVVVIPSGSSFTSTNSQQDTRQYQILSDVIASEKSISGGFTTFTSPTIQVAEGKKSEWKFIVNSSVIDQKFVIKDPNIDVSTISIKVKPTETSNFITEYKLAKTIDSVDKEANVFYLTTNELGQYQVFFGNDVFGTQPSNGNVILASYLSSNGDKGNGAKTFRYNPPAPDLGNPAWVGNFNDFTVITESTAGGGMVEETLESLRRSIPAFHKRQGRVVTEGDFREILLEEFRNIDSLNVWGGEKHVFKDYGKVYCSLKPKNNIALTATAKQQIQTKILENYGIVGTSVVFVDPEYLEVSLEIDASIDFSKTSRSFGDIQRDIVTRAEQYNSETLNKFDSRLSELALMNKCQGGDPWIQSIFSQKTLAKSVKVLYRSTGISTSFFGDTLKPGTIKSEWFDYGAKKVRFEDVDGKLYLFDMLKNRVLVTPQGDVDYSTGTINFKFPQFGTITGYSLNFGVLKFMANPEYPDVNTTLNNIVQIVQVTVRQK